MGTDGEATAGVRELVLMDSASALRWFQHDYPHPLARWHHHPEVEIHLITASSGIAQIGNAVRPFAPGDFYLLGSGLPHNWVSTLEAGMPVPGRDMLVQFDPERFARVGELVEDLASLSGLLQDARRGLQFHGATRERAAAALASIRSLTGMTRFARLLELLDLLARAPEGERELLSERAMDAPLGSRDAQVFDRAVGYVHAHLGERILLADVARELGLGPTHVSRLFSRATGVGFARTVIRLRIFEACRLLLSTDEPIADLCFRVGFTNLSNFNRRFREETGTTPRAYRAARPTA